METLRRSGQWSRLFVAAGRRRREIWRGLRAVRRLGDLELPLTEAPSGEAIRRYVQPRPARFARPVLPLPAERGEYGRGRARQALRTNVRRAEALGITCHEEPSLKEKEAALDEFMQKLGFTEADRQFLDDSFGLELARQEFHAALDADGHVVALAVLEVDVRCARLLFLRSVGGDLGGPARYALSLHVIHSLIDRKVSHLLVAGAVRLDPGLQYFQQRLGFELFNVRPVAVVEEGAPARQRRLEPGVSEAFDRPGFPEPT